MATYMLLNTCVLVCFNDPGTTEIYTHGHTLTLHDSLPIFRIGVELIGRHVACSRHRHFTRLSSGPPLPAISARSRSRPRCRRDITVPTGTPMTAAASS